MSNHGQLIACSWTSAGDVSPLQADQRSPVSFRRRVEASAGAGFSGMGFSLVDLAVAEATYGLTDMAHILDDNGIEHLEFSITTAWWVGDKRPLESLVSWMSILRYAEQLHASTVKVSPEVAVRTPRTRELSAGLARASRQAAGVGARFAVHLLPWAGPASIVDALSLAVASGTPTTGIVVDGWQVESLQASHQDLARLPSGRVAAVELSDGPAFSARPSRLDAANERRNCGEGAFRLERLVAALRTCGFSGPWGVQIVSAEHRSLAVEEGLARAASAARTLLGIVDRPLASIDSLSVDTLSIE